MNEKQFGQRADYILTMNGGLKRNAKGDAVTFNYFHAREPYDQLRAGWAGGVVVGIFREYPWLESMTIEMKASDEYDDDGRTYRSVSVGVADVERRQEIEPPEDAIVDGQFDADIAASLVEPYVDHCGEDLYDTFYPDCDSNDDVTVKVCRETVSHLLDRDAISGKEAFTLLFPDYAGVAGDLTAPVDADELKSPSVFVLIEDGDSGICSSAHSTRAGAEQALRDALAAYQSGGAPVFTPDDIDREVLALTEGEHNTVEVMDRASLWISVCELRD